MALGWIHPLTDTSARNISWGVKVAGAWSGQSWHLHVLTVLIFWEPQPFGTLRASPGIYLLPEVQGLKLKFHVCCGL